MKPPLLPVSIVITFSDAREALRCVRTVLRYGGNVQQIILAGRGIDKQHTAKIKQFAGVHDSMLAVFYPPSFSLARVRNSAAKKASADMVCFINGNIRFYKKSRGLLEQMASRAAEPEAGAASCLVLAPDKYTIRHAGVFKLPGQPFHTLYYGYTLKKAIRLLGTRTFPYDIRRSRPVLAVSGPLLVNRRVFVTAKGFNERPDLEGAPAFVEFCLRLTRVGRRNWFCAGGSVIDIADEPPGSFELPLRLSKVDNPDEKDPVMPKLGASNLRVPRHKRHTVGLLSRIFAKAPRS